MEKIAVVVDSGSDVNQHLAEGLDIFSLPLRISIDGKEYTDGIDITAQEVFDVLDSAKVTTSLPTGEDIINTFERLKSEGYTHIIAVTISSGLSGTFNVMRNLSNGVDGLEVYVFDTKNISLGSGLLALHAAEMVRDGVSFSEIVSSLEAKLNDSEVFFTVGSLDYLLKGGRIGLVAGTVANVLNIKPIISCNDEGVYYTVSKARGYGRVIKKMVDAAAKFVGNHNDYKVYLLNADSKEDFDGIKEYVLSKFNHLSSVEVINITPALAIHTGPEALGIAIIKK